MSYISAPTQLKKINKGINWKYSDTGIGLVSAVKIQPLVKELGFDF
jgi:hypothetical protein